MTDTRVRQRPPTTGPRGGKTTVTKSGLAREAFPLHLDEVRAVSKTGYEQGRAETDIAVRRYLDIED